MFHWRLRGGLFRFREVVRRPPAIAIAISRRRPIQSGRETPVQLTGHDHERRQRTRRHERYPFPPRFPLRTRVRVPHWKTAGADCLTPPIERRRCCIPQSGPEHLAQKLHVGQISVGANSRLSLNRSPAPERPSARDYAVKCTHLRRTTPGWWIARASP